MTNKEKAKCFQNARLVFYAVFVGVGILTCVIPYDYACYNGVSCLFCGMRYAIDCVLELDIISAYHSNKGIVILLAFGLAMTIDLLHILQQRINRQK